VTLQEHSLLVLGVPQKVLLFDLEVVQLAVAEIAAGDSLCLIVVDLVVDCSVVMLAVAEAGIPLQVLGQSQGLPTLKFQIRSLPIEAEVKLLEKAYWVHPLMFLALGHLDF